MQLRSQATCHQSYAEEEKYSMGGNKIESKSQGIALLSEWILPLTQEHLQ